MSELKLVLEIENETIELPVLHMTVKSEVGKELFDVLTGSQALAEFPIGIMVKARLEGEEHAAVFRLANKYRSPSGNYLLTFRGI